MAPEVESLWALFPPWSPYVSGLLPLAFVFLVNGVVAVLVRRELRRRLADPSLHWSERARRAEILARADILVSFIGLLPLIKATAFDSQSCGILSHPWARFAVLVAIFGINRSLCVRMRRGLRPNDDPERIRHARRVYRLFLAPTLFWAAAIAMVMPEKPAAFVWCLFGAAWAALLWIAAGGSLRIATALGWAKPAPAPIIEAARDALPAGVKMPEVLVIDTKVANAIAFPFSGTIACELTIENLLSPDELRAVLRHEMAHLREPRLQTALRMLPNFAMMVLSAWNPITEAFGGIIFAVLLWAFILPGLFLRGRLQAAEKEADHAAHEHEGRALADALLKMYAENLTPAVARGTGGTHPHLYDRVIAAGVTPDFPRPAPPPGIPQWITVVAILVAVTGFIAVEVASFRPRAGVILSGGTKDALLDFADARETRVPDAARAIAAAALFDPADASPYLRFARKALGAHDDESAAAALAKAESIFRDHRDANRHLAPEIRQLADDIERRVRETSGH